MNFFFAFTSHGRFYSWAVCFLPFQYVLFLSFLLTRTEHISLAVVLLYDRGEEFLFVFFVIFKRRNNAEGAGSLAGCGRWMWLGIGKMVGG